MLNENEYKHNFKTQYNKADGDEYGRARMTTLERTTLRELQEKVKDDVKVKIFGNKELNVEDKQTLREITRTEVVEEIIRSGWPQPDRELVEAKDVAESGSEHACVVAEYLVDVRGAEAGSDTFFSYTTKNQLDRYVSMKLIKFGRLKKGGNLFEDWHGLQNRQEGYKNSNVRYPEGVDDSKIYGVAKPHRYWPAQLMRNLEAIRLGKISEQDRDKLMIGNTALEAYVVPWNNLDEIIQDSESVDDMAVGIAIKVLEELKAHGLNDDKLIEVLMAGYSPGGPLTEHGDVPQVHEIWSKLLNKIEENKNLSQLKNRLQERVQKKIEEKGFVFRYIDKS
jgi:hypothetical protein